jgi:hypothetical protein
MHENPIATVQHLPGDLRVAGFVRIPEIPSTQIEKVKDKADAYKKKNMNPFGRSVDEKRASRGKKVLSLL